MMDKLLLNEVKTDKRGSILGEKLFNIISFMGLEVVQGSGCWEEPSPPDKEILHGCVQGDIPH